MAREYKKKARSKPAGNAGSQLMFVLISFICGYLSASLISFAKLSDWVKTQALEKSTQVTSASAKKTAQQKLPKPKFEFYTLLANEQGPNPSTSTAAVSAANPNTVTNASNVMSNTAVKSAEVAKKPNLPPVSSPAATVIAAADKTAAHPIPNSTTAKESYSVQIASFGRKDDAEKMKASLILKGFNVNIAVVNQNGINWYRVVIGPYVSRVLAEKASSSLGIRGMIRRTA